MTASSSPRLPASLFHLFRVIAAAFAFFLGTFAPSFARADVPVPKFDQRCKDLAKIMSEEERVDLDRRLVAYEQATGNQIAILVIKSLDGEPIEDFAYRVFKEWKLGDEKKDNGILIVAAIKERRLRFEIGKGLEGDLTDLESSLIIREQMRPFTKQERWHEAFQAGLGAIEKKLSGRVYGPVPERPRDAATSKRGTDYQGYFLTAIFLIVFVVVILRALKGGGRGGGGGGPPIIFFGGGGFWRRRRLWWRRLRRPDGWRRRVGRRRRERRRLTRIQSAARRPWISFIQSPLLPRVRPSKDA